MSNRADAKTQFNSNVSGFSSSHMATAMRSSEVLQRIKNRQAGRGANNKAGMPSNVRVSWSAQKLAEELQSWLSKQSEYKASTQQVLKHFEDKVAGRTKHVFRTLLREMAEFSKGSWALKESYR